MKRILISSILSFICMLFMGIPAKAEFKKTKIAVLDFQLQGARRDDDMGKIVAEWLITALVKEGRFDVVERRYLEKVLEQQKLGVSGLVDESSASRLGKVLGAKIVITGSVMQFQNIMEVNARIIEVESSSIIAAENVKSTSAAKLEDLVVQMAEKIIRDFPLEGYIVQREGNTVLIDLGKRTGVKKGMQFVVYQEGRVIKHPKTGEVLDIERIETGTIEITDVKVKTASAIVQKETSPNAISNGHLVKSNIELATLDSGILPDFSRKKKREQYVSLPDGGDLNSQLALVQTKIEELRQLKTSNNNEWKMKFKEVDHNLDILEKGHKRSPDIYLARARSMEAIDRLEHADKFIRKALSVRRNYPEAYSLRGDMYVWDTMKSNPSFSKKKALKLAVEDYENAAKYAQDKDFQATMYLKIGNAYVELEKPEDAAEFWQKAVAAAPASQAARTANEKLPKQK